MGLGGGGLGGILNSITGASQSARQQNQYAVGMSKLNYAQQKDMLLNGPSWQMEGYDKAGVNPTYGLGGIHQGGGTASGTGGGTGGLSQILGIVDAMNNTKSTNAGVTKTKAETNAIPQQLSNDATNAKANLISAEAERTNAETNRNLANKGLGGKVFGLDGGVAQSVAASLLPLVIGGAGGAAIKGYKAYKGWKAAKGFGSFLKSLK